MVLVDSGMVLVSCSTCVVQDRGISRAVEREGWLVYTELKMPIWRAFA
jgi:hypothetical protein